MPLLEYTLGLKTADFDKGIKNANVEAANFSKNLLTIGANGGVASRSVTGGFHNMREGARGAKEGMTALSGAAELLGYQVAPQATIAVRALFDASKALGAAARLSGLGLGGLSIAGIGLAATLATVFTGYQAVKAEMEEIKSEDALETQYDILKERLIPQLEKYVKLGRLAPKAGQAAINLLKGASNENKPHALKNAQDALRPLIKEDAQFTAGKVLDKLLEPEKLSLLPDKEREKQEFLGGQDEKVRAALDLAKKSGLSEKPITDLFNKVNQAGLKKIDDKYAKEKKPETPVGASTLHTALQQMGLVYKSGVGGGDAQAATARNTARIAAGIDKIVSKMGGSGGSGGSLRDPFMNDSAT